MQGCRDWGRLVKVGGSAFVAPRLRDRLDYLVPRHPSSQLRGKRGCRKCDSWLAADGCNDLLRPVEQDGPMLQECTSLSDLCRAHQLATGDEDFTADRSREARRRLVDPRGWWRLVGRQSGIGTQGPERGGDPFVDGVVRVTQRAERCHRGGYRVGHLVLVPHGPTTRRSPHHVEPALRNGSPV